MKVRRYRADDAEALAEIFHAAVHGTAAFFYSHDQCAAWSPQPDPERFANREHDGRAVFVATVPDDIPCGFIELEPDGHIDCFYVHPEARTGTGASLYDALLLHAQKTSAPALKVEASEPARRFFLKRGFSQGARQQIIRNGIILHNTMMSLSL